MTDITVFWGFKRFLQISRWYTGDTSAEIRTTDTFTQGNASKWLDEQALR